MDLDEEWEFIFPVEGLVLRDMSRLTVGPVIFNATVTGDRFLRWRQRELRRSLKTLKSVVRAEPTFLDQASQCDTWAIVRAEGDSILAEDRAYGMVSNAIDVLRLYLAQSETGTLYGSANFGLYGEAAGREVETGRRIARRASRPTRARTYETLKRNRMYGAIATYKAVVTPQRLDSMRDEGFELLCSTLTVVERTQLQERASRAVAWFSQAVTSHDRTDRFLKTVIALDALLGGGPQGEASTTDIAERGALVLSEPLKARRARKKDIVRYFRLRGNLAHGGRVEVPFEQLFWAEFWVRETVKKFVVNHLNRLTFERFLDWVEDAKFS